MTSEAGTRLKKVDRFFWEVRYTEHIFTFGFPLVIASTSILLLRGLTVLLGLLTPGFIILALFIFLVYVLLFPFRLSSSLMYSIGRDAEGYGSGEPTNYLQKMDGTMWGGRLAYGVVIALYVINSTPYVKGQFNLSSDAPVQFLVTLSTIYSMTLMVWIIPIFFSRPDPFAMARLNLRSQMEENPRFSFDRVLDEFNLFLRRTRRRVKVRDDVSLEVQAFANHDPSTRRFLASILFASLDRNDPLRFVEALSLVVNRVPTEILGRARRLTLNDVATLVGLASAAYGFVPLARGALGG